MHVFSSPNFLRNILWADAASAAITGALHLAAAGWLAEVLGLPSALLLASGGVLAGVILLASWLATRQPVPRAPLWILIIGNWLWVVGCLALLFTGAAGTPPGQAYLVMHAVTVGVLAELEWMGMRRSPITGWA